MYSGGDKIKVTMIGKTKDYFTNQEVIVPEAGLTGEIWARLDALTFVVKIYIDSRLHYLRISAPFMEKVDTTVQKEVTCSCGGKSMGYRDYSRQHLKYCDYWKDV